jgi:hypothetical protein
MGTCLMLAQMVRLSGMLFWNFRLFVRLVEYCVVFQLSSFSVLWLIQSPMSLVFWARFAEDRIKESLVGHQSDACPGAWTE